MTWGRFGLASALLLVATVALLATVLARGSAPASAQQVEIALDDAICMNGTVIPDHASKTDLVRDCENLVAAVNHWRTNTINQRRIPNWAAEKDISTWEGITISGTPPRVTGLDLNSNPLSRKLRGRIPPELGNLSELRSLNLSWNYLSGDIPSSIWTLTELRSLRLDVNNLTGSIPAEVGNLTELTTLNLSNNQLSGELPSEIGRLSKLVELVLHGNGKSLDSPGTGFTGPIPPEIGNLTELTRLYLHINSFSGPIPDLSKLTNLKKLSLYENELTGGLPSWLPKLTLLESVHLYANQLTGTIPDLSLLTNLRDLHLHRNQLSGSIPATLASLPLTDLYLRENDFSGCIPGDLYDIERNDMDSVNSLAYWDPGLQADIPASLLRSCSAPQVVVSFEQGSYTVAEGSRVTVRVTLSADPEDSVTVPLTVTDQGGALSGTDYEELPGSVIFEAGETSKDLTFRAYSDDDNDDGESVKIGFGTPTHNITVGAPGETTVTITDDDVPSVTVSFESSTYTVAEGSSETIKVKLSADPERTVTIPIDASSRDGALSPDDYTVVPESVVFNSGETEQTFTFNATQDTVVDRDESVDLVFGSQLPEGVTEDDQKPTAATVNITDDDDPQVTVSFEQGAYDVDEGSSVDVIVRLSADPLRTVTISVTATGQGGADSNDYSGVPTTVTFNSGDTEKVVAFSATQDTEDDEGKSVNLGLTGLPAGVTVTQDPTEAGETVVSINDDDDPEVSFGSNTYTVVEGSSVTVTVKLSSAADQSVTIPLTTMDQGGASSDDYSVVPIGGHVHRRGY